MKTSPANGVRQLTMARRSAFTLIELLAVMVVIVMLAGITIAASSYVRQQAARSTARSQIAAMAVALDFYKADWGYYPRTGPERLSADCSKEASNNCTLLNALCPTNPALGRKVYLRIPAAQILSNPAPYLAGLNLPGVPNFFDPWGKPYVYYNSPVTPFGFMSTCTNTVAIAGVVAVFANGYTVGGQVNVGSYDLFSFGPDRYPYVPGAPAYTNCGSGNLNSWLGNSGLPWTNKNNAVDDITNWSR